MGVAKRMLEDADDHPKPPPEAFKDESMSEIDNEWLQNASREQQVNAMRVWFLARYCDPAYDTPYSSDLGGYIYVSGGPYSPSDELVDRFAGVADEDAIQELADELYAMHFDEWAPTSLTYYVREEDVFVDERYQPTQRLEQRLQELKSVLTLSGDEQTKALARNIVYASIISALETFLWETVVYWVEHDESTVESFIKNHPIFRDEKIALGSIFDVVANLKIKVRSHLQHVVWHRWEQVAPLFKYGLSIVLPSVKQFEEAIQDRHDIVHRSGQTESGAPVVKMASEVEELSEKVLAFANKVDLSLSAKGFVESESKL